MAEPRSEADDVLADLVAAIREELGDELLGLYLYGSKLSGDFDPEASDLDLLAVLSVDVHDERFDRLDELHRGLIRRHPAWANRLDIIYINGHTLGDFRKADGSFAVISPGEPFHRRADVGDWIQSWYLAREGSQALEGAPASSVIPPIRREEFEAAISEGLADLRSRAAYDRGGALAYEVLTACRAFQTLRTETMPTKSQAAAWTMREMPEWAWLIDAALACRHARGKLGFNDDAASQAAQQFIGEIARRVASGRPATRS